MIREVYQKPPFPMGHDVSDAKQATGDLRNDDRESDFTSTLHLR